MHFEEPQEVDSEDEDMMFVQKSISIEEDCSDLSSFLKALGNHLSKFVLYQNQAK